jgi:hypothetical protein
MLMNVRLFVPFQQGCAPFVEGRETIALAIIKTRRRRIDCECSNIAEAFF